MPKVDLVSTAAKANGHILTLSLLEPTRAGVTDRNCSTEGDLRRVRERVVAPRLLPKADDYVRVSADGASLIGRVSRGVC